MVAICDIDKSTKRAREKRFIGAKGIGFKSVPRYGRHFERAFLIVFYLDAWIFGSVTMI